MEDDYLPAQMNPTQSMVMKVTTFGLLLFALVSFVLVVVEGIHSSAWFIIAIPLLIFLVTTMVLLRWLKDGGMPDTGGDQLKYVTVGNAGAMFLICIGILTILYASAPTCPRIPSPGNGLSGCANADILADGEQTCVFACNPGFGPAPDALTCQTDGSWSDDLPTSCSALTCPALVMPTNGNPITPSTCSSPVEAQSGGSICTFSCQSGFQLQGPSQIVCAQSGEWSDRTPECTTRT